MVGKTVSRKIKIWLLRRVVAQSRKFVFEKCPSCLDFYLLLHGLQLSVDFKAVNIFLKM